MAELVPELSFSGRVSFVPVQPTETLILPPRPAEGAWAVDLVQCDHPDLAGLPVQFLGDTWIVPDLSTARRLRSATPGLRFVTHSGEVLEAQKVFSPTLEPNLLKNASPAFMPFSTPMLPA